MAASNADRSIGSMSIKRVYDHPSPKDGVRVLVDGLWPRGMSKDAAKVDIWLKEIAPSAALRQWFHHDPQRWSVFKRRYRAELAANTHAVDRLRELATSKPLTLLFAAHDTEHNNAVVLLDLMQQRPSTHR